MTLQDLVSHDIKAWHIATVAISMLLTLFKQEISNTIYAFSLIRSKKFHENQPIQIMSSGGVWEDFTLIKYTYFIPFRRLNGGVTVEGKFSTGKTYSEKLSFQTWKSLRTRTVKNTTEDTVCEKVEIAVNAGDYPDPT